MPAASTNPPKRVGSRSKPGGGRKHQPAAAAGGASRGRATAQVPATSRPDTTASSGGSGGSRRPGVVFRSGPTPNAPEKGKKAKPSSLGEYEKRERAGLLARERRLCPCSATKHDLYTNCLKCGKILCAVEGPGPCTFCHAPVDPSETFGEEFEKAIRRKNILLRFQAESEQRTRVFDAKSDFFDASDQSRIWLTAKEQHEAKRRARAKEVQITGRGGKRQMKIEVDESGKARVVVEMVPDEPSDDDNDRGVEVQRTGTPVLDQPKAIFQMGPKQIDTDFPIPKYVEPTQQELSAPNPLIFKSPHFHSPTPDQPDDNNDDTPLTLSDDGPSTPASSQARDVEKVVDRARRQIERRAKRGGQPLNRAQLSDFMAEIDQDMRM